MKKLQVKINGCWDYVFCSNASLKNPVVTKVKNKAINYNDHSLGFFSRKFANLDFRSA